MDESFEKLSKGIVLNFVPSMIVSCGLEELFFEDKKKAIYKIIDIFKEETSLKMVEL